MARSEFIHSDRTTIVSGLHHTNLTTTRNAITTIRRAALWASRLGMLALLCGLTLPRSYAQLDQFFIVADDSGRVYVHTSAGDGTFGLHPALELPGHPVVDTNGAGDNLAVGFLVARHVDGEPPAQAASRAQLGARWICSQRGDAKQPATRERLARLARQVA